VRDFFVDHWDPTIEDAYRKSVEVDAQPCQLEILDTAGQDDFESLRPQWMMDKDGTYKRRSPGRSRPFSAQTFLLHEIAQMGTVPASTLSHDEEASNEAEPRSNLKLLASR
jgi:GTPase KRas protein